MSIAPDVEIMEVQWSINEGEYYTDFETTRGYTGAIYAMTKESFLANINDVLINHKYYKMGEYKLILRYFECDSDGSEIGYESGSDSD